MRRCAAGSDTSDRRSQLTFDDAGPRLLVDMKVEGRARYLAMLNLAIDSQLRGWDVVAAGASGSASG